MSKSKTLLIASIISSFWVFNTPLVCSGEVEIKPDDVARNIFLGQVYGSGNVYSKTVDRKLMDPSFWPARIKYHSLISSHPEAARFGEASFLEIMKDRREKAKHGYDIYPKYIPYEEGMQKDVCNQIMQIKEGHSKKYLDGGDFFDSVFYHCEVNDGVAVYKGVPNNKFSYQIVAFREKFEIEKPKILSGAVTRPLTSEEQKEVNQQKEKVRKWESEGECTTVTRFPDEARQYFTAKVKDSDLWLRISMYQSPGCAGHLARYYLVDILRGNQLLRKYELVKYEGAI